MRLINGKPIRTRGGRRGVSDKDLHDLRMTDIARGSSSKLPKGAKGASIFWMVADVEETTRDHVIPRTSLTVAQHLKAYPTEPTFEDRLVRTFVKPTKPVMGKVPAKVRIKVVSKGTRIDKGIEITDIRFITEIEDLSPANYVETTDSKVVKKGDKSLLLGGIPFKSIETEISQGDFKRLTSQSKRITNERTNYSPIPDSLTTVNHILMAGSEELHTIPNDHMIIDDQPSGIATKVIKVVDHPELADRIPKRYAGHSIVKCKHGIYKVSCSVCKELGY